jgi:hypothetical protein
MSPKGLAKVKNRLAPEIQIINLRNLLNPQGQKNLEDVQRPCQKDHQLTNETNANLKKSMKSSRFKLG